MRNIYTLFLLFFATSLFAQKKAAFTTFPNDPIGVKKSVLDNGMQIYLIEDHNQPRIFGAVAVRAGGKYDPADATGMGHYLEHMLFKGTQTMGTVDYAKEKPYLDKIDELYEQLGTTKDPEQRKAIQKEINDNAVAAAEFAIPNELDRMLAGIGSQAVNAFTSEEMIVYHNYFPPNQVEKWLDIYSERFINPVFRLFQSELETVYEEKNRAMDGFIYALLKNFNQNMWKNHPYGQQELIGSTDHLKNPSLEKMYAYFEKYYVSNNMALILSGDFDAAKVMPMIKAKFGRLKRGKVPKYPDYPEAPFNGRELVKGRYTPVAAAFMGFRTVPTGHPDGPALDVANYFLSNAGGTGLLDRLALDQKILVAQLETIRYDDHGASLFIVVPKIVGQSVKKAEQLVLGEVAKIKAGNISEAQLKTAKLNILKSHSLALENLKEKALFVTEAFISRRDWSEIVRYPEQIEAVSLERVMEVAKAYYGDDYLILQSKMGFPKKEKLQKPPYSPPIPKSESKSSYAQHFAQLPASQPRERFVDFENDVHDIQLSKHAHLFHVENPTNNIFQINFRYGIGTNADPVYQYVAAYMSMLGTSNKKVSELKEAFNAIGCTYEFAASADYFDIRLEGIDQYLPKALQLLRELVTEVKADQDKVKAVYSSAKTDRKLEQKDVQVIGKAALDYAMLGEKANGKRRYSLKKIKGLQGTELVAHFNQATQHAVEVHYTGTHPAERIADALNRFYFNGDFPSLPAKRITHQFRSYDGPTVYFLDRKDAIQSQVYFYKESEPFSPERAWLADAFNEYFGGGMSSLVFQEIREFRSLAYTARAFLRRRVDPAENTYLNGYIGCQADKTLEALEVMTDLIHDIPAKPERISSIRDAIIQSAYTSRPGFRDLSRKLVKWRRSGYQQDPAASRLPQYKELTWEKLNQFYTQAIKGNDNSRPLVIVVTGDSKRVDKEALKKFGQLVELDQDDVIVK